MTYLIITILKLPIGIAGVGLSLVYFIPGLTNKDQKKTRTGILIFVSIVLLFVMITIIEFVVALKHS
ncbi:hypothetical protein [Mucilaginibacter flavidus]|uniref:hypothetical protein n=1 Tax=Mucilaginibacter flavidus TaxID=2949309 RepID=UPI002093F9BC|nr:hypothetical protein [Mucilaginibacter flavidus]MCO5949680.1 hypothetical protein [Mucilaginibacter flavidus]